MSRDERSNHDGPRIGEPRSRELTRDDMVERRLQARLLRVTKIEGKVVCWQFSDEGGPLSS